MKKRIVDLCAKILSFKFLMFVITTVLRCCDVIGNGEWLTVTCIVICGIEGQKVLNAVRSKVSSEY